MEKISIIYCREDKALIYIKAKDMSSVLRIKTLKKRIDNDQYEVINPEVLNDYLSYKLQMETVREIES